jgi:cytochrome c oxidase accessory protein FixG
VSSNDSQNPPGPGRIPDLETVYTFNEDGSRNFLHPADVKGRWQTRKSFVWAVLILIYAILPWITINGHPAVLIDIRSRDAFLFGKSFTNQDVYFLFFLLTGIGFGLFVLTALWGRVWCGFGCPQTVFMEGVFRRIERWIEGPRNIRIRRNQEPMSAGKLWRKLSKHAAFLGLSIAVAHVFLAYFIPARDVLHIIGSSPVAHRTAFIWVALMSAILYFDYSWFREQTCLVVCPYGRLQSALIDSDTVNIGYDTVRGEPRVKATEKGGDCVDCRRCVLVCPTGIDIRNGLQMECIGCSNCIDACDEIMGRLNRPRGLVRYDSKRGFEGVRRGLLRPRFFLYAGLGVVGLAVFIGAASRRTDFEARALRTKGMPYMIEEGKIRNLFNISIQNKEAAGRVYFIRLGQDSGPQGARPEVLISQPRIFLEGLADATIPVFVRMPRESYTDPFPLRFIVRDSTSGRARTVETRFLGP